MQRNCLPWPLHRGDQDLPPARTSVHPKTHATAAASPGPAFLEQGQGWWHWSKGQLLPPARAALGGARTASTLARARGQRAGGRQV